MPAGAREPETINRKQPGDLKLSDKQEDLLVAVLERSPTATRLRESSWIQDSSADSVHISTRQQCTKGDKSVESVGPDTEAQLHNSSLLWRIVSI